MENLKILWTLTEAAEQLSVSTRTLRRMIDKGQLPHTRVGRSIRIPVRETLEVIHVMTKQAFTETAAHATNNTGEMTCRTAAKTHQSGGQVSLTKVAEELDALLGQKTTARQRP